MAPTELSGTIPFFDTHAHLNLLPPEREAREAYDRAVSRGMAGLVNIGTRIESSRESIALARELPHVWATVGIHPSEAASMDEAARADLLALSNEPRVVGIGETGLDIADIPETPLAVQESSLRAHIWLARERNLPLILHCRDAFKPIFSVLDSESLSPRRGVFHCFTGQREEAFGALDRGFWLSFSGIVTFKNAQALRDLLPDIPRDRILLETDCPYLAPVPFRGKTNEPALLPETLRVAAGSLGLDPREFSAIVLANTRRFFGIDF